MWFIGVEAEQETRAPPPKRNPGSAPERHSKVGKGEGTDNIKFILTSDSIF